MKLLHSAVLLSAVLLTACNSAGVKPQSAGDDAVPAEELASAERQVVTPPKQPINTAAAPAAQKPQQIELIANRLTAVQDHLLQIKSQAAQLQQQNQALSLQLQQLQGALSSVPQADGAAEPAAAPDAAEFNGVLDQITMLANEMSNQVQNGAFQITSAYTAKGEWVLIRYHRYSGETWLADKGQWIRLEESTSTGTAEYDVVLLRAEQDVKVMWLPV